MSKKENKFDIFLSYYGKSLIQVQRFYQTLTETYNLKVWVDFAQIKEGDEPFIKVREGIQNSTVFIVCLSREYEKDENCLIEFTLALETFKRQVFVVFFQRIGFRDVPTIASILQTGVKFETYNAPIFDKGLWLRTPILNKLKFILNKTVYSLNDFRINTTDEDIPIKFKPAETSVKVSLIFSFLCTFVTQGNFYNRLK